MVAVTSGNMVRILDKELKQLCVISEKMSIKNCVWDEHGVLLYATLSQIKYCLPSGEKGIVRSLDEPVYIAAYRKGAVFAFTRDAVPVIYDEDQEFEIGKAVLLRDGRDVALIANGDTVRYEYDDNGNLASAVLNGYPSYSAFAFIPLAMYSFANSSLASIV